MRPRRTRVGARTLADILADPQASSAELRTLAEKMPQEVVAHVNCPVSLWWDLAMVWPLEAQASLLYPLITLEEPGAWAALELANVNVWIRRYSKTLSPSQQRLFACDCADRVLPLYERGLSRSHCEAGNAIQAARDFALGKIDDTALEKAWHLLSVMLPFGDASWQSAGRSAAFAAEPAKYSDETNAREASKQAHLAVYRSQDHAASLQEWIWQWHRLQAYLRGEAP